MGLNVCLNKAVVHCQREKCTTADTRVEESVVFEALSLENPKN